MSAAQRKLTETLRCLSAMCLVVTMVLSVVRVGVVCERGMTLRIGI